jgi:cell division septum initiation protein DivIVA
MKPMNVDSWADVISFKLEDIKIVTISQLRQEIVVLNKKLKNYGHSMLHIRTLDLIAREAEKESRTSKHNMNDKITRLQNELVVSHSKERIDESGLIYLQKKQREKSQSHN